MKSKRPWPTAQAMGDGARVERDPRGRSQHLKASMAQPRWIKSRAIVAAQVALALVVRVVKL